ncbi:MULTISPECIES: pyrroloquinoline quinone-dependent dehydrogenase [Thioclava]|uniref:pyrroloquinoline quinone-dependent dehydrogenase n=1 Tax=Thioclava TaxID=285107 RepID=UPI000D60E63E|nr:MULTISPECIES: pyrroloquinoline quinone-dependent dehydrogenase [Thioclava]PWE51070.1 pyrroloquinoline quinone-dependent dehydrogenase [Thioclava sp. NG1]WGT51116.1 pyrroloquinoline quinone-dependent dehydrogenase [Thioclava nitratireducens]
MNRKTVSLAFALAFFAAAGYAQDTTATDSTATDTTTQPAADSGTTDTGTTSGTDTATTDAATQSDTSGTGAGTNSSTDAGTNTDTGATADSGSAETGSTGTQSDTQTNQNQQTNDPAANESTPSGPEASADQAKPVADSVAQPMLASGTRERNGKPLVPEKPVWNSFHGQLSAQKYSPLTQINPDNVGDLEKVWQVHTGDVSDGSGDKPATVWSATPIFANDTLYIGTPFYRVLALDPATGEQKWAFDTKSKLEALTQPALKNRGVAYWQAENPVAGKVCQKIVYIGTMDARLFALDADTGKPCPDFGKDGVLDVNQWNTVNDRFPLSVLQPPTVAGNHLILGWAGQDWEWAEAPPGAVFSVDAQTGKLQWSFETLPENIRRKTGTANVWTAMSVDPGLNMVYLPVASPSPNYWGGNRTQQIPYATSTTALDLDTGKVVWSRQWVHHDIWDYDINSAPTLMDITVDGKEIPALMQGTKMGFLFVVNRETGEDVWPIEERPVPQGDGTVKGEVYAKTQPFPTKPAPLLDQSKKPEVWGIADLVSGGACSKLFDNLTYKGMYTPPTTTGEGTLAYPDSAGGVQWGGVAFDPNAQIAVVNTSHIVQYIKLWERQNYEKNASGSGNEAGFYPQKGAPYGMSLGNALNWLGMPCWKPPFGELVAIDMHTGDVKWRKPLGSSQKYGFFMPESMGSPTIGGPAVTKSGLIFIGATMDAKARAYDIQTGKELWSSQLSAPVVANPAIYEYKGREYVAFISGGNSILKPAVGDLVAVYALPQN